MNKDILHECGPKDCFQPQLNVYLRSKRAPNAVSLVSSLGF